MNADRCDRQHAKRHPTVALLVVLGVPALTGSLMPTPVALRSHGSQASVAKRPRTRSARRMLSGSLDSAGTIRIGMSPYLDLTRCPCSCAEPVERSQQFEMRHEASLAVGEPAWSSPSRTAAQSIRALLVI